jgi:Uma2 family endonuclease
MGDTVSDMLEKLQDARSGKQRALSEEELLAEDLRYEVIDGIIYMMAPPVPSHQVLLREILRQLSNYFHGKPCEVFPAPFGFNPTKILAESGDEKTIEGLENKREQWLEPDLTVVCDPSKFDGRYYKGVPTMIVEIASPSTAARDDGRKKEIYEKIGVNEYWLVIDHHNIYVYLLKNRKYEQTFYTMEKGSLTLPVASFPDLEITLDEQEITKFAQWYNA